MALNNKFYKTVHLDLKGLPPTPKRLCELPEMFASFGLNSILVEWEDTFPYRHFPELKAHYTYSLATIKEFLRQSRKHGITVIPLIQTFGHLESLLMKDKYKNMRELKDDPRDICPLYPQSRQVISDMIADVLEVHLPFGLKYFHLGADEVWSLGHCRKCRRFVEANSKEDLFLYHMNPLFEQVNSVGVRAIIWHDMLREMSASHVRELAGRVDLMFWSYTNDEKRLNEFVKPENIRKCNEIGIGCWAAGAYKGADGPVALFPKIDVRAENTLLWKQIMDKYKFQGYVLTAWSRYSTSGACCEPLEVCWDSLAVCMKALRTGKLDCIKDTKAAKRKIYGTVTPEKNCVKNIPLWDIYSSVVNLQEWADKFSCNLKHLEFFYPQPDGRINVKALQDALKENKLLISNFNRISEAVKSAMKNYVPLQELEYFLQSKLIPRKRLSEYIVKELNKSVRRK